VHQLLKKTLIMVKKLWKEICFWIQTGSLFLLFETFFEIYAKTICWLVCPHAHRQASWLLARTAKPHIPAYLAMSVPLNSNRRISRSPRAAHSHGKVCAILSITDWIQAGVLNRISEQKPWSVKTEIDSELASSMATFHVWCPYWNTGICGR